MFNISKRKIERDCHDVAEEAEIGGRYLSRKKYKCNN